MKFRAWLFAFLILCFASPSQAIYFPGELSSTDPIAVDEGFGDFYYDLYYLVVDVPMTMYIFMTPTDPFAPWLGYWDGDFSSSPDYDIPPPVDFETSDGVLGAQLIMSFDALPGIEYQIMAATYNYNPTEVGSYNFFILDPEQTNLGFTADTSPILVPQEVPSAASWIILALGLIALGLVNRFGANQPTAFVRC